MTGEAEAFEVDGAGRRVALIVSRFNGDLTRELAAGAREALHEAGVAESDVLEVEVPGAFELAPTARQVVDYAGGIDAIVALGVVIRGETAHFDFVGGAAADGLQRLAHEIDVPVAFGVLTTDTREQALERADRTRGNKGGEAARAALAQVDTYERIQRHGRSTVQGFGL